MDLVSGQNIVSGAPQNAVFGQQQSVPQGGYVPPTSTDQSGVVAAAQQNVQKMFTQEELNYHIQSRVNGLNQQVQTLSAQLKAEQDKASSYANELNGYKQRDAARMAGVGEPFLDYAVFGASRIAVGGKDFQVALAEFIAANPQVFGVPQQAGQPADQSAAQGGVQPAPQAGQVLQPAAQTAPAQAQPQGGVQQFAVVPRSVDLGSQPSGVAPQPQAQPGVAQPAVQPVAAVGQQQVAPAAVQYGGMAVAGVGGFVGGPVMTNPLAEAAKAVAAERLKKR